MEALLRIENLSKRFGATQALDAVSLEVAPGSVHAVVGENGAGKSTLVNVLFGALCPDDGRMTLGGVLHAPTNPTEARASGVAMVHQEPMLCPDLSVHDNILLGIEPTWHGLLDGKRGRVQVERALAAVTSDALPPTRLVGTLSSSERQMVALARALAQPHCRLLVLDEPTSSLTASEVEHLFGVLGRLRQAGVGVVYISHFLEEVKRIADGFTVLRDGKSVASGDIADVTQDEFVRLMVGRDVGQLFPRSRRDVGEPLLSVRALAGETRGEARVRSASLELRAGEVLGIAGLVGAGRTELLRAIFGLDRVTSGELRLRAHVGVESPARRWARGAGFVSEDRIGEGLAPNQSVAANLTLTKLGSESAFGWVSPRGLQEVTAGFLSRLRIRARDPWQPVRELSGGNQQKVALARLLHHDADVLLLDEPTRGIDVQSRAEVYQIIDAWATEGKAVLMVSSYLPELLGTCDRIAVMHRGTLGPARSVTELDQDTLLREAIG